MSPALVQALQRLLVIAVIGALSAVGVNLTLLNGTLPNAAYLIPVILAVITAALKYLGGATIPASNIGLQTAAWEAESPPFWSV